MVLGASFDTVEDNAAFASKFSFPYPLLSDSSRALAMAYGAADDAKAGYPRRVSVLIGPDGRIRHVWPKVDPRSHPTEVLGQLG